MNEDRKQAFPGELLKSDATARKKFFHDYTIKHPVIDEQKKRLLDAIEDADSDTLIFVYGPAGVGKSTLRHSVKKTLTSQMRPELEIDRSRIPPISEELRAPNPPAFFSWADNFQHLLFTVDEPLVERKISLEELNTPRLHHRLRPRSHASGPALRYAYEAVLENRRPSVVLLDEAQVLTQSPAARLLDQLNVIKSIASHTKIPHVLFGTYSLLPLRDLDGQIARRSVDIHFPRYTSSAADRKIFANAVRNLAVAMPFDSTPNLDPYIDLLHEKSAGCIGVLKGWLMRSYGEALRSKSNTLTFDHIQGQMYSPHQLMKMFSEIAEGEEILQTSESDYEVELGRIFPTDSRNQSKKDDSSTQQNKQHSDQPSTKRNPGERRPGRDPIGSARSANRQGDRFKVG